MAHESQVRYSEMTLAKIRKENKLKDGVVFNNDYEGSPKAGLVKIPVRDIEVAVSDYDRANGIGLSSGSTTYENFPITKDKAVNELIDGYEAQTVPGNLVADRIDSAGYSLASVIDNDGATVLIAGGSPYNTGLIAADNVYSTIVDVRTEMSKANIPNDGKRYLLVTPDTMGLILRSPEFIKASDLGDAVVQSGAVGRIAGFLVIEWNDSTANLAMIAGHPRFATRAKDFKVDVHIQDLSQSGKYIGATAVQGRMVYDHKVLRSQAIRTVFAPGSLGIALAKGSTAGKTVATVTGDDNTGTLAYKVNPSARAVFNMSDTDYGGTTLTSGTTQIAVSEGNVIEIANIVSNKVKGVGYITVKAADIKGA